MTAEFVSVFVFAVVVNVIATFRSLFHNNRRINDEKNGRQHNNAEILKQYLPVYLLAVFSDWIKGPYGYELYSSSDYYNYGSREVFMLCSLIPFASSLLFGTFLCGPLSDGSIDFSSHGGRKQMTKAYAIITIVSNFTKFVRDFKVAVVGSILDGISTSLLFTVFDSWLVRSFRRSIAKTSPTLNFDPMLSMQIPQALATAEYSNNIIAIGSCLIATCVVEATAFHPLFGTGKNPEGLEDALIYIGGVLNPFTLSSFALVLCLISIYIFWGERFDDEIKEQMKTKLERQLGGDSNISSNLWWKRYCSSLVGAFMTTIHSKEIILTGMVCSLFESAMFVFVFTWTNVVVSRQGEEQEIPFGLIHATFMMGCMAGTHAFTILLSERKMKNENIGKGLLFAATCIFLGVIFAKSIFSTMIAFFLFELTVGIYFPMMGTMKSKIVPEKYRTTIYNFYRIPFNIIMMIFLWFSENTFSHLSQQFEFPFAIAICTCLVATAFFLQVKLIKNVNRTKSN